MPHARGKCLETLGRYDDAEAAYRQALQLRPDYADALNNLASAWKHVGRLDDALRCYRGACLRKPDDAAIHSSLIYCLLFHPECDPAILAAEHRR